MYTTSGKQIHDNKGRIVERHLPYDSPLFAYEDQSDTDGKGQEAVPPTQYRYDALGRLTEIKTSKGFVERVRVGAWHLETFDAIDALEDSPYYETIASGRAEISDAERQAVEQSRALADTPDIRIFDNQGNAFLSVRLNKHGQTSASETLVERSVFDAAGRVLRTYDARFNRPDTDPNAAYRYDMRQVTPIETVSIDAGVSRRFANARSLPAFHGAGAATGPKQTSIMSGGPSVVT